MGPKASIKKIKERIYSRSEEIANAITHGVGALLSVIAFVVMLFKAYSLGKIPHILSSYVFGISLILLYTASTIFHAVKKGPTKLLFNVIDHSAIYVLIAGTYTPFLLVLFKGWDGWAMLATVWSLALIGIIYKLFFFKRFRTFSTIFYLAMGWLILIRFNVFIHFVPPEALNWLLFGGILYSVGVVFYLLDKVKFSHTVWHFFVLGGSACHFFAVYQYVLT